MFACDPARRVRRRLAAALITAVVALPSVSALPVREGAERLKPRTLPSKSLLLAVGLNPDPRVLVVKLADDAAGIASRVGTVLSAPGVAVEPLIPVAKPLLDLLRLRGETNTGEALADLSQFYRVRVPAGRGVELLSRLLALPEVENAYAYRGVRHPTDVAPPTPDFLNLLPGQGYRNPAPEGIDIAAAGIFTGAGVTVADVEAGWNLAHEDLDHLLTQVPPVPVVPQGSWGGQTLANVNHGTASLGVLAAGQNGYGTAGLVPGAKIRVVPILNLSQPSWSAPTAVVYATLALKPGDVMLLEVEDGGGLPFETFDVEFSVVRQATALGIHVVEPAGNTPGGIFLDNDPQVIDAASGKSRFDWSFRDSGAILVAGGQSAVGAGGGYHNRYVNSNFGTRVDAYSWGQNVTTLGYGPQSTTLANCANPTDPFPAGSFSPNQRYTYCYNGTSAAGSIVAGAVAVLENRHAVKWGVPMGPRAMRNHLRLGTPGGGGIGHQPDLAYHLSLFDVGGIISQTFLAEPRTGTLQPVAKFGSSIASPGDVDIDGFSDIAIGARDYSANGTTSVGRVYLISAQSGRILWTADGLVVGEGLGSSLAALGDVNGDGIGDLAAGAPGDGSSMPGTVRVLSGADGSQIYGLTVGTPAELFGSAVAGAGADYNFDGAPELLVGVPGANGTSTIQGRVELRSGRTGALLWARTDPTVGSELGFSVAGVGDLNGDGWAEVIAGAPREVDPATGKTPGAIYVLSGRNGKPFYSIKGEIPLGTFNFSAFGASVSGTGDLNADGRPDFVVGAPGWTQTPGGANFGKAYIYGATATGATLLRSYTGAAKFEAFGKSVAGIGDYNGDGLLDIAVGQPAGLSSPGFNMPPGKVYIYLGPFNVPLTAALARKTTKVFATKDTSTTFGVGVAALGDTNGDTLADVGAGEPNWGEGRAFVFSSGPPPAAGATAQLVAEVPAVEARDTNFNGFSGGGLSPETVRFHFKAGAAFANAHYRMVAAPKPPFDANPTAQSLVALGSPYLINFSGTLDSAGETTVPVFGPIPAGLLCPGLAGAQFDFYGVAELDADGDGIYEQVLVSNPAMVEIIWEYFPQC